MYKVMVVDDDRKIVYMITEFMKIHDMNVVQAFSGKEAIALLHLRSSIKILQ